MRLQIDRERYEVRLDGKRLDLTTLQFDILALLYEADGRVVSREQIMRKIYGWPRDVQRRIQTRTIDQHISRLRRALRKWTMIRTIRNRGFSIERS